MSYLESFRYITPFFFIYVISFTFLKFILLLQLYFTKITELAVSMPDSILFKEALMSLATDSGLHPLVPYFTCFIEDEVSYRESDWKLWLLFCISKYWLEPSFQVSRGLNDFKLLFALMRLVWSLLQNPHIHVEPYVSLAVSAIHLFAILFW